MGSSGEEEKMRLLFRCLEAVKVMFACVRVAQTGKHDHD